MLIRRTKNQVLTQLPERIDKNFFVSMTPQQRVHHEENREAVARIVVKWRRYKFLSEAGQRRLMIALQNMRMSCDSTYLLDHQTDFGVKADELMTLLDDLLEQPGSKVVVFSQWVRMHELLVRRLKKKRIEHVLFHGGVDGSRRKALIDRFRDEDRCRAFLSTDAGGVGLNLQHASIVVNMDLPWNPAVLEQRIGRVHRLGQRKPVQVINFIAEGTIEEGMLSVLTFKKSLFAGVLDGGEREVFLGGSRLSRFMDAVEKTTTATASPPGVRVSGNHMRAAKAHIKTKPSADAPVTAPAAPAAGDWAALMQTGLAWLEQLAAISTASRDGGADGLRFVHRDPQTGAGYARIPLPPPELLDGALVTIGRLLDRFRR